jgi:hypothetical protein
MPLTLKRVSNFAYMRTWFSQQAPQFNFVANLYLVKWPPPTWGCRSCSWWVFVSRRNTW